MEDHQRALIARMNERIDLYRSGEIPLPKPVRDVRGLFEAAYPRGPAIRDSFEEIWAELDAESFVGRELGSVASTDRRRQPAQ